MQNLYLVYSSPYGHARRYAEWIAEELGCPCVDRRQADPAQAAASSALLLGGGLYAGGLSGIDFLRKNRDRLREKPIYLFTSAWPTPRTRRTPRTSGRAWSAPCRRRCAGVLRSSPSAGGSTMRASPSCTAR